MHHKNKVRNLNQFIIKRNGGHRNVVWNGNTIIEKCLLEKLRQIYRLDTFNHTIATNKKWQIYTTKLDKENHN